MHEPLTLPYQASLANWGPWKKTDASPATCVECVEPIYPPSEITSQCTDKCVVIACNDPGHDEEISCHRAQGNSHCDLVCEGTRGCSDCNGFDEFVSDMLRHIVPRQYLLVLTGYYSYSAVLITIPAFRSRGLQNRRVPQCRGIPLMQAFYAIAVKKSKVLPAGPMTPSVHSPLPRQKSATCQ